MLSNQVVYGVIAALIFILAAAAIGFSFADGPGLLRDILPDFLVGDEEQVEWDRDFFIEDPQYVVIRIDTTPSLQFKLDAIDDDDLFYRYGYNLRNPADLEVGGIGIVTDIPLDVGDSWEFRKSKFTGGVNWERLNVVPSFTLYSAPQNRLLTSLKGLNFETGLQEILRHYVQNRDDFSADYNVDFFVGNFDDPLFSYDNDDPRLRDVDFIIDTINRATRAYKLSEGIE